MLAYNILGKILKSHTRTINIILAPTWNKEFELPNGSYFVSDIQNYLNIY